MVANAEYRPYFVVHFLAWAVFALKVLRDIPRFDHKATFELNFLSDNCNSGPRDLTLRGVAGCALHQTL